MSDFSKRCKELINENGTNVYQLSKSSGLDRTTLQRMVTGKRLPGIPFVNTFCKQLRIPPMEEIQLLELYEIENIGKEIYQNRQYIRTLVNHLAATGEQTIEPDAIASIIPSKFSGDCGISYTSSSAHCTQLMIQTILSQEFTENDRPQIWTNLPPSCYDFLKYWDWLYQHSKKESSIHHLIRFHINPLKEVHTTQNLEVLHHVLPFALSTMVEYSPYYYYSKLTPESSMHLLMPYYIGTEHCVLEISSSFTSSILHTAPDVIQVYKQEFNKMLSYAKPLIKHMGTPEDALAIYAETVKIAGLPTHTLEFQPCYSMMMEPSLITKLLVPALSKHTSIGSEIDKEFSDITSCHIATSFFSRRGLTYFCDTGHFSGQVASGFPALTPRERKAALKKYMNANSNKAIYGHLLTCDIDIPRHISIELYNNKRIQFIQCEKDFHFNFFSIEESSICSSFLDFFNSLADTSQSLSPADTNKVLQEFLLNIPS